MTEARDAIRKLTGAAPETPPSKLPPSAEAAKGWEAQALSGGRFVATNSRYPRLRISLEMYGPGVPEILEWTPLSQPLQGFGLLRYAAGNVVRPSGGAAGGAAPGRYEYVVILDYYHDTVVSIEPYVMGDAKAAWEWTRSRVVVTDQDGVASTFELRKDGASSPVARDDDPTGFGGLFGDERPARRSSGGSGRRSPGLFDWLFR